MPDAAPSNTEVALRPGELPHLLLRITCAARQTAGELLARVLARHTLRPLSRWAYTQAVRWLCSAGWLCAIGHAGRAHQYALTTAEEVYFDSLYFEIPRPRRTHEAQERIPGWPASDRPAAARPVHRRRAHYAWSNGAVFLSDPFVWSRLTTR